MSQLENLPPDLRAVLSLLLRQRKRYAEVAALLDIEERAVHDRAHAALALLAPREARELSAPQREQVGEYLLGQQDPATESRTRAYLEESTAGRTWARALSGELGALATRPLPPVPAGPAPASTSGRRAQAPAPTPSPGAPAPARAAEPQISSSRVGGAVILGVLAAVVIVAVLLIVGVGGGGGSSHGTASTSAGTHPQSKTGTTATGTTTTAGTGTTTTGSGSPTTHGKALTLTPPSSSDSKAVGVAYVLSQKGQRAFYVFAKGLPRPPSGVFYAVWLEGAASAADYPLGSLPTAQGASGLVEGGGPLPTNASSYHRIIVTSETSHHPSHPGPTVLGGAFSVG